MTIATDQMVVHKSGRLHEGITDCGSDKTKAALLQRLGKRIRLRGAGRDVALTSPTVSFRRLLDEAPDESVETAELLLHRQQGAGVADGALDLETITYDGGVFQQRIDATAVESCNPDRIEFGKGTAITVALVENRLPGKPGLGAFQHQKLEQPPIVMKRNAPFLVVIGKHACIASGGPVAANVFSCRHDWSPAIIARGASRRQSKTSLLQVTNAGTMLV